MSSAVRFTTASLLSVFIAIILIGCATTTRPIAVSVIAASGATDQGQTVTITASVANDTKNAGVQWTLSGAGSLTNESTTSATYAAPASVTSKFTVTITATSITDSSKSALVEIAVNPLPAITSTSPLPTATAGVYYFASLTASGGSAPLTWSGTGLPNGLSVGVHSGAISGTPTSSGNVTVVVTVTDAVKVTAQQSLALTVNPPAPLSITTTSLPAGAESTGYSQILQATGGVSPYMWSLASGSLPSGLTLTTGGLISGTPTKIGTSTFTVEVTDSETPAQSTTQSLSITINAAPLKITTASTLPQGLINTVYSGATLEASGGTLPYTWSYTGNLPPGLNLSSSGVISGTPTTAGTFTFTATVADSSTPQQTASQQFTITVNAALAITTTSLPGGSVGAAYAATLAASGGLQPYSWSLVSGSLPGGLTLTAGTGGISGTPTATGTFDFTVEVTDSETPKAQATANLSITIFTASCPNNSSLSGNYAIALEGWIPGTLQTTFVQGAAIASFAANGAGNISTGNVDTNDGVNGHQTGTFTGTYCIASNNLGTMTLTFGAPYSTSNTFAFVLNTSDSNGKVMYYDSTGTKEIGPLHKQATTGLTTSSIKGNYTFGMIGTGAGGEGSRFAVAGQFDANGTGGLSGSADGDDSIAGVSSNVTIQSTSTYQINTSGIGTASFAFAGGEMNFTLNFVVYEVSDTYLLMMETDNLTQGTPLLLSQAFAQTYAQGGSSYGESSLSGNVIIGMQAIDYSLNPAAADVLGGILNANGSGSGSISFDENDGGTISAPPTTPVSITYTVASNGRVVVTGGGSNPPILYLYEPNGGFVVGTDGGVIYGEFGPQSGSNFANASLNGSFTGGSDHPQNASVGEEVAAVNANGNGSLTGTSDDNVNGGSPQQNTITDTYTVSSNGRTVVKNSGAQSLILYIVNSDYLLAIPAGSSDTNPALSWWISQ